MVHCSTLTRAARYVWLVWIASTVLVVSALAACGTSPAPHATDPVASRPSQVTVDPATMEQALLNTRALAIRRRDLALFLSIDDPTQQAFIARDRAYFAAVSSLPWGVFDYRVTTTPWPQQLIDPAWGRQVRLPQVVLSTQLAGFDTAAVSRVTGFAFATRGGRTYITSDRTVHGHLFPGYQPEPWDIGPVTVARTGDAIGVFDVGAESLRRPVMAALDKAIAGVGRDLPYSWTRNVVLYATTKPAFANALTSTAGGDLGHLGAVTYPMDPSTPGADDRVLLLADALSAGAGPLSQIIRHEVTHVALGPQADGVPLWLVEGIAEYEGAKAIPSSQWQLSDLSIQRAKQPIGGLPATATFHNPDQDWHYAVSWMACEYVVRTGGEPLLWELLDSMSNGGLGTTDAHQDLVLDQVLGMNGAQLALHAVGLIRSMYG